MEAQYAFWLTIRLEPDAEGLALESPTLETRGLLEAAEPGTDGWLFFRDTLWRGDVADEAYARELFSEHLGVPVDAVEFRGLHADEAYLEAFKAAIAADLEAFKAETVSEVLSKYLGSSLEIDRNAE